MRIRIRHAAACLAIAAATWTLPEICAASERAAPSESNESYPAPGPRRKLPISLEQLTITAHQGDARTQEAPLAVSAFGGDGVQDLGLRRIEDLAGVAPNLAYPASSAGQADPISIRGLGGAGALGSDTAVGFYVDGVLTQPPRGLVALADVERVEVLRGTPST